MQQPLPTADASDLGLSPPTHSGGALTPWARLKFNPVGVFDLRRYQGTYPAYPLFYSNNTRRFRVSDLAWFSAGMHADANHHHSADTFHPMHIELYNDTKSSATSKTERKALVEELEIAVWDMLTMLDRISGSTSLLMRCKGTVVPGSPAMPEYIKAQVYFPPVFINHNPSIQPWLRTVCQAFIENVGVCAVMDWETRSRNVFKWSFTQSGLAQPNTVLPSASTFPAPEKNTSRFIYPGQPCSQHTPVSSQLSAASSYAHEEITSSELQILDLHDQLREVEEQLQHAEEQLERTEEKLASAEENFRLAEHQNSILIARVNVLESGTGILINSLQTTPVTSSRRPTSSQTNVPSFGVNAIPDQSSFSVHATPASRFTSPSKARAVTPSDFSPIHVTLRKTPSRQNTPSKPKHHTHVGFQSPTSTDNHLFQSSSSRNYHHINEEASEHQDPVPRAPVISDSMLSMVLQAHGLQHLHAGLTVMLRYIPPTNTELRQELIVNGVPQEVVDNVARAISFDKATADDATLEEEYDFNMPPLTSATIQSISAPRVRSDLSKTKPIPLTAEQREEKALERDKTRAEIDAAVQSWFDTTAAKANELAERFNKKPRYFLDIFFHGGARMVNHHEKVNPHNAFVSLKAQELREMGSEDAKKLSLLDIQRQYKDEYDALGEDERKQIVREFKENIDTSKALVRPSPRGRIQDVANVVRNIILLIEGLKLRAGVEGFFCIVRSTPSYHITPQWYFSSDALSDYMRLAVAKRWNSHELGLKLEAFAIAGCDPINMFSNAKKKAGYLKAEIRYMLSMGLVDITGNPKAVMQYLRYEEDVVLRYGIELIGWTYENLVNPSELSTSLGPLTTLFNALKNGECKFVKLSPEELKEREAAYVAKQASGQAPILKRKRRSDAGKPRKKVRKGKTAESHVDDEGSDENDDI